MCYVDSAGFGAETACFRIERVDCIEDADVVFISMPNSD